MPSKEKPSLSNEVKFPDVISALVWLGKSILFVPLDESFKTWLDAVFVTLIQVRSGWKPKPVILFVLALPV